MNRIALPIWSAGGTVYDMRHKPLAQIVRTQHGLHAVARPGATPREIDDVMDELSDACEISARVGGSLERFLALPLESLRR